MTLYDSSENFKELPYFVISESVTIHILISIDD